MHILHYRKVRNALKAAAITALVAIACLMSGCMFESGVTTVTNISVDGHSVNATRSHIANGDGEFECLRSASGRCHYLLFVEDCGKAQGRAAAAACKPRIVTAFTLPAGASKHLAALPAQVRECVSHDAAPVAPGCLDKTG